MTARRRVLTVAVAVSMALAACAGDATGDGADGEAAPLPTSTRTASDGEAIAGMCAEGEPDCEDMVVPGTDDSAGDAAGACPIDDPDCGDNPATGPDLGEEAVMVTPRAGLVDVAPTPWEQVTFNDDQTVATVYWWGGNDECFGLDRVEVDLESDAVTITVFTGTEPGDVVCTMQLVAKGAEVDMGEPLGPRSVLDGAA
jgi:hypothetical protein